MTLLLSLHYLDTPSTLTLPPSAYLLPLRACLTVILLRVCNSQKENAFELWNQDVTILQPLLPSLLSLTFVHDNKLHSSENEVKEPKTKVYRKQDKNQSKKN
jgi:hypothetical protein